MTEPQLFIENNGLIYKLYESKEERLKRIKQEEDRQKENLQRFKKLVGEEHCEFLHENAVILEEKGNYGRTIWNFKDFTTGFDDDYGAKMRPIGDTNYEYASERNQVASVHKLIANYYYQKCVKELK